MTVTGNSMLLLRTSVTKKAQRKLLGRGLSSLLSAVGIFWIAELLLPLAGIEGMGIWRWIAGGGVLGATFLPYHQIVRYKFSPEMLRVTNDTIILTKHQCELLRIHWNHIQGMHFLNEELYYGIALTLHPLETPSFVPKTLLEQSKKHYEVDLFLPFFSEHSFQLLQDWNERKKSLCSR